MEKVRLGDVCTINGGYAFKSDQFSTEGVPVIRIGNITKEGLIIDEDVCYDEKFWNENDSYRIAENDILIAMSGATVGKSCINNTERKLLLNQRVAAINCDNNINLKYIFYSIDSEKFSKYIMTNSIGCAQPNISLKQIANFEISAVCLEEQNRIADELDKVTDVINKRKQQISKLDELVKARFVELFGDPETNSNGWKKVTVGDVCSSIVRGPFGSALKKDFFVEPSDTTYKVYEQKHAIQKSATIGTYYVTEEKYQELKRFECVSGDIIMSCSGTMGELYQLPEGCERGIINQALCKFTLNDKMLPVCFLTYMKQTIGNLETKGSGIKNIAAVSYVKAMPINLPPMDVQLEFENFCKQTDKSKLEVQKSLEKLELLKKALMQKYFG